MIILCGTAPAGGCPSPEASASAHVPADWRARRRAIWDRARSEIARFDCSGFVLLRGVSAGGIR